MYKDKIKTDKKIETTIVEDFVCARCENTEGNIDRLSRSGTGISQKHTYAFVSCTNIVLTQFAHSLRNPPQQVFNAKNRADHPGALLGRLLFSARGGNRYAGMGIIALGVLRSLQLATWPTDQVQAIALGYTYFDWTFREAFRKTARSVGRTGARPACPPTMIASGNPGTAGHPGPGTHPTAPARPGFDTPSLPTPGR